MTVADFNIALPEIILALYAIIALMFGAFGGKDRVAVPLVWVTAALFVALSIWIGFMGSGTNTAFGGMFIDDPFARFFKITILLSAAAVMVMSQDFMSRFNLMRFEFPVLLTLSVLGMCMMTSAGDLMSLYIGLELQALSLYIIAAMRRDSLRSSEAGLKYFIIGSLSAGLLLYGASLIYGYAGTTLFSGIISTLGPDMPIGMLFGIVFMLAGLAYEISAVPFHMWTPDVYEGSPTPVTAFFATAPKVAGLAVIARLAIDAFGVVPDQWTQVLAAFAVATMFLGAIGGIGQWDFKRLMAYSSISHMGFALIGLAAGTAEGIEAAMIYMAIYVVMNVGAFAFIMAMERNGRPIGDIRTLNMYSKAEPTKALALSVLLFSLAGVPPFVGFFAKFVVFKAAIDASMTWLAFLGVIAAVIGAFYYLRIVYYMYFGTDEEPIDSPMSPVQWTMLVATAVMMLVGSVNLFGMEPVAHAAARAFMN